ncbi:MAG: gfo/Idh/MocA family oxidoreductase [Myxococcales bacterium]|nr:MAG: gfo/Idh/MocA family oxidoreductase [Myxococcales bacterium]
MAKTKTTAKSKRDAKPVKRTAKKPVQPAAHAAAAGSRPLRVGLIGAGWISTVHYDALKAIGGCEVVAQADIDPDRLKAFGESRPVRDYYPSHHELLKRKDIDVVTVAVPNRLHAPLTLDVLKAGKHVIVEKPLCLTIAEAEEIVDLSRRKGLVVGYGEELCYVPKFVRMKQIADSGALGDVYMVKQTEKHSGPYSPWFWTREGAGGGILMDMGCHAIEFCRWFMGKKPIKSVWAHCAKYLHTWAEVEDHVILTFEFADGALAHVESSWALQGGMASRAEAYGTKGVIYGDLLQGMGLACFTPDGYPEMPGNRALVGGPAACGWTVPDYEWLWNNGYPQEMRDFLDCIRTGGTPIESAQDGLEVLEIMLAAYHSAGTGKRVALPFRPNLSIPVDLWLSPRQDL